MGNGNILLDEYVEVLCCQDIRHPGGRTMPATVTFGSGSISMGYARDTITLLIYSFTLVRCSTRTPDPGPMV